MIIQFACNDLEHKPLVAYLLLIKITPDMKSAAPYIRLHLSLIATVCSCTDSIALSSSEVHVKNQGTCMHSSGLSGIPAKT